MFESNRIAVQPDFPACGDAAACQSALSLPAGTSFRPARIQSPMARYEMELLERSLSGADSGLKKAGLDSCLSVEVPPATAFTFFSHGYGGCQGVAVLSRCVDGTCVATLSHYLKSSLYQNQVSLGAELEDKHAPKAALGRTAYLLVPRPPSDDFHPAEDGPEDLQVVRELERAVKSALGAVPIEVLTYDMYNQSCGRNSSLILAWSGKSHVPPVLMACDEHRILIDDSRPCRKAALCG